MFSDKWEVIWNKDWVKEELNIWKLNEGIDG